MYDVATICYMLIVNAIVAILISHFVKNSKFGLGLLSIKNDEVAAESCGIPTTKYKLLAFGITAILMGSTGAIMASRAGYIDPDIAFPPYISVYTLVMGILGGIGSLAGGIISAIVLSVLFEVFLSMGNPYPFGVLLGALLIASIFLKGKKIIPAFRFPKPQKAPISPEKGKPG
jgi:branched-chain amino acid transport system permease protein